LEINDMGFFAGATVSAATVFKVGAVLLMITFIIGFGAGFITGRSSRPIETTPSVTAEQEKKIEREMEDLLRKSGRSDSAGSSPSSTPQGETPEQARERKRKDLRDKYNSPSPTPKLPGQ
jgi:hypothetical protein